jgi:uncharacterized protein (TIGR00255 family)
MTGFGDASGQYAESHFFVEVRSLNNKYFKSTIRLPEDYQGLEAELESELRRRLTRGTITMIGRVTDASAAAAMEINHEALSRYIDQVMKSPAVASGRVTLDLGALLDLPGVVQPPADEDVRLERARIAFVELLGRACDHLLSMRTREGSMLVADLRLHHSQIAARLAQIQARTPLVVEEYEKRLRQRVETLLKEAGLTVEPSDLIREIAIFAERSDVAEEVQRLSAHLEQFDALLREDGSRPIGRTLDFLSQEMLREANTIASKSGDSVISREIVEIKGAIDRIKEQVQNVE